MNNEYPARKNASKGDAVWGELNPPVRDKGLPVTGYGLWVMS